MDEITKALGPFPVLQWIFGIAVLGLGVWSIIRGLRGKEEKEDSRAQWEAYNQLTRIDHNVAKMVATQEKITEATNRLVDVIWNNRGLPPNR